MGRKGSEFRRVAALHVLFALFVQFAPSIHTVTPHDHSTSSCTHGSKEIHFEKSVSTEHDSPCILCAHLLGRQAVLFSIGIRTQEVLSVRSNTPLLQDEKESLVLKLPDSRGPPPTL